MCRIGLEVKKVRLKLEELARKERRKVRIGYGKIRIDGQVVEMGRGARSTEGRKEQGERGKAEGKGEREKGVHRIEEREGRRGRKIEERKVGIESSSLLLSS